MRKKAIFLPFPEVQNTISINAAVLKAGKYLLKVTTDRESVTKSLLVTE